jgi:hypothetical protein
VSEVEDPGVELLTDAELAAVVRVVRAFVDHDEVVLRDVGAYAHGDPYEEARHWRLWDHVDLVIPPGDPRHGRCLFSEGRTPRGFRSTLRCGPSRKAGPNSHS